MLPIHIERWIQTADDSLAKTLKLGEETHLPIDDHCGAFGVRRKHDVHTGIDLYTLDKAPVACMADGEVVAVMPFTGAIADTPWWNDTYAVVVRDLTGFWLYGEITPEVAVGDVVVRGQVIGAVAQVLKIDKGRPLAMLHIERYAPYATDFAVVWTLNNEQPIGLLDPTPYLYKNVIRQKKWNL